MEAPHKFVLDIVKETVTAARKEWPRIIREVSLPEKMRDRLYGCWGGLYDLLRLGQWQIAAEKLPGGIRAAYPRSRVIGTAALVSRTHVGDNPRNEHWGRFLQQTNLARMTTT